jgi:hypothetical protein
MRTILCRRGKGEEALARMRELMGKLKLTVNRCHSLGGRPRSGRRSCQQRRALAHSHRSVGSCGSIEPTRFSRHHPLEPRRGNRSLLRGTSGWSTRSLRRAGHECNELNVACWLRREDSYLEACVSAVWGAADASETASKRQTAPTPLTPNDGKRPALGCGS